MKVKSLFKSKTARLCVGAFLIGNLALATVTWASMDRSQTKAATQTKKRDTNGPFAPNKGKMGQELFIAIGRRDVGMVKGLLKQGADPNSENALTFSPLFMAAASYQMDVMEELIKAGAEPDYDSSYGTALSFAAGSGNAAGMQILLSHGADPSTPRNDGMTPLMMAAVAGAPPAVELLVKQKIDVNTQDDHGATALSFAARGGHDAAAGILLGAGAKVDLADKAKQTPLMIAASAGNTEVVRLLLAKGANPNAKDANGKTALILASAFGDYPEVVSALKAAGANPNAKDASGRTPAYYASARGHSKCAELLGKPATTTISKTTASSPRTAVLMSLKLLQASMTKFNKSTACISCHHEGLGRMATGAALSAGFKVDPILEQALSGRVNGAIEAMKPLHEGALKNPQMMLQVPLIEINEVTSGDTWLLMGRAAHNPKPDAGASAMAMVVAKMQSPDGSWTYGAPREPMESSYFTYTALAARSLKFYAPKSAEKEVAERFRLAQQWLATTPTKNSEDRASKLLGLKWTGASQAEIKKAADAIIADQRPDGGWAQLDKLSSDAYATGQALYALHESGAMPVSAETYKKGVKYLLRTQQEDGSWFVNKRAFPGNNHFEAGFPYGKSQFSSFNGTCWAMMALLPTATAK